MTTRTSIGAWTKTTTSEPDTGFIRSSRGSGRIGRQLTWFAVSGVLAALSGIYALIYTQFNPITIGLFAFGALTLLAYTYPFKYWGLGELAIFLIWGPIMIGGVNFVVSGIWNWNVVLAGVPYGLGVASINVGRHIDKRDDDLQKGVGSFPCAGWGEGGASHGPGRAGVDLSAPSP